MNIIDIELTEEEVKIRDRQEEFTQAIDNFNQSLDDKNKEKTMRELLKVISKMNDEACLVAMKIAKGLSPEILKKMAKDENDDIFLNISSRLGKYLLI